MDLSFFRPMFLWALPVVAVPVFIHLFFRGRVRERAFSSLRFFNQTVLKTTARHRLRRILLLATRVGILLALVFLFARPFRESRKLSALGGPSSPLYVWIDPSPSMSYTTDHSIRQKGFFFLDSLARVLGAGSRLRWFDNARDDFVRYAPEEMNAAFPIAHGGHDLLTAIERLAEMETGDRGVTFFVMSDFQIGNNETSVASILEQALGAARPWISVCLVDMRPDNPWNYCIDQNATELLGSSRLRLGLSALEKDMDNTECGILSGPTRIGSRRISLPANTDTMLEVEIGAFDELGQSGGVVRIAPGDPMEWDDRAYFAKSSRATRRILVVGDRDKTLPISAAFRALDPKRWGSVVRKNSAEIVFDDIDTADLIVMHGSSSAFKVLEFLAVNPSGGSSLIFSPEINGKDNTFLEVFRRLDLPLPRGVYRATSPRIPVLPDTLSDLWKGFPRTTSEDVKVDVYIDRLPGKPLLFLDNGDILFSETTDRFRNRWILSGSPLIACTANNLCETGFFVPLMDRLGRHVVRRTANQISGWIAGEPRPNPFRHLETPVMVYDSANTLVGQWSRQASVQLPWPGLYRLEMEGKLPEWIAVNASMAETQLSYRLPQIPLLGAHRTEVVDENGFVELVRRGGRGNLLNRLLWAVLALFLLLEGVVGGISRFKKTSLK